jgi:hypothetical protein
MKRNSLLITESERRQIMSLYGLITEGETTTAKYEGTIVLPPNQIYEKFEAKVNFKKGDEVLLTVDAKSDYTFEIETQVEDGVSYEITIDGSYRVKGSKKDTKFSGEKSFTVEVTKLNDIVQPINQKIKIPAQTKLEKQEVRMARTSTNLNVNVFDYRLNQPLKDIDVEVVRKKRDGEEISRTNSKTDNNGDLLVKEGTILNTNSNVDEFLATKTMTINVELIINVEGYKPKKVETKLVAGTDSDISIGLISTKEFKQEIDDFKSGLYVPETYKSNFFTIYGHTKTPLENDKEGALKLARLDAYSQFLKKVRKKYSENDIVKNAVPEGGEIVFKFPPNQDMYYYIVKYKRSELKKFVKSLLKVKDDVEIEDEPKTNKDLVFEDISLNTALLKSKTQGKNIFILKANDGTNMDNVLKVLNEDKVFVKNTNDTKVRIRIEVDDESEDYNKLVEIFSLNRLSIGGHPQIIYMNKDQKILNTYDYYAITTDGKYKL